MVVVGDDHLPLRVTVVGIKQTQSGASFQTTVSTYICRSRKCRTTCEIKTISRTAHVQSIAIMSWNVAGTVLKLIIKTSRVLCAASLSLQLKQLAWCAKSDIVGICSNLKNQKERRQFLMPPSRFLFKIMVLAF